MSEKRYNRYRFMWDGKWSGWRKCDLTEKELSEKVGNPYISRVEWKNVWGKGGMKCEQ